MAGDASDKISFRDTGPVTSGDRICFSIPGEVTDGFLSQIAMFDLALRALPTPFCDARVIAYLGCEDGVVIPARWQPHLRNVEIRLIRRAASEAHLIAQAPRRFTEVDDTLDYVILCDADTMLLGGIGDVLLPLAQGAPVAGVIAHLPPPGFTNDTWRGISTELSNRPIELKYPYTLQPPDTGANAPRAPFYLNHGFVAFRADALRDFCPTYLDMRKSLASRMKLPIFAGQVGLSITLHALGWQGVALPMRYNFPNDDRAFDLHRSEIQDVRVLHYLRENNYLRSEIFAKEEAFRRFVDIEPASFDRILFDALARLTGGDYPFS